MIPGSFFNNKNTKEYNFVGSEGNDKTQQND